MSKIAVSHSRLEDFEACPLLFREKYITKTVKFVKNIAMERGDAIHKALERNAVRAMYNQDPVANVPYPLGNQVVLDTHPIIKAFVNRHPMIATEEKSAFNDKWKLVDFFAKDAFFRSIIDLEGRTQLHGGVANVIDYKTGKYNENKSQLKRYNMVMLLKYPEIESATSTLLFVDHKRNSPPVTTFRSGLKDLVHDIEERAETIQIAKERDDWPPTQNWKCRFCGVVDCKYARR